MSGVSSIIGRISAKKNGLFFFWEFGELLIRQARATSRHTYSVHTYILYREQYISYITKVVVQAEIVIEETI